MPRGAVLGPHDGTFAFTVGQRRGLGVATGERRYVVEVDAASNRVVVGPRELLSRRGLIADRVSWVPATPSRDGPFEADVRIRYRGDDVPAVIEPLGRRGPGRVPQAAARGGARAERRGIPGRRAPGRRPDPRSAPLTSRRFAAGSLAAAIEVGAPDRWREEGRLP